MPNPPRQSWRTAKQPNTAKRMTTMNKKKIGGLVSLSMVIALLASIGYMANEYISLPERIAAGLKNNAATPAHISHAMGSFGVSAITALCTILLALVVLLLNQQTGDTQVVYVKESAADEKNAAHQADGQQVAVDLSERIGAVENAANQNTVSTKISQERVLGAVCKDLEASQAALFVAKKYEGKRILELFATYAYHIAESKTFHYEFGEGLAGQVAREGRLVNIKNVPDGYITILSGLGSASPTHLVVAPVLHGGQVVAVLEVASFRELTHTDEEFIKEAAQIMGRQLAGQFVDEEIASLVSASAPAEIPL